LDLHIYGTGRDREIVKAPHKGAAAKETTAPVDGRPFAGKDRRVVVS
jgi:hypothetical protein